jgi:hypothetical protein
LTYLAGLAHDRELDLYLSELEGRFHEWRQGTISSAELSDFIHEFHDGSAQAIYSTYAQLKPFEAVARAIGVGLLREDEVLPEIKQGLAALISHFRHTYKIDEADPLARLRREAIQARAEGNAKQ